MENLGEEALARLDVLAAKMGVGAEHMWEVLVRQGMLVGQAAVAGGMLWTVVLSIVSLTCLSKATGPTGRRDFWPGVFIPMIIWFLILPIFMKATLYLFNPEMYALEYVRRLLQ